MPVFQNTVSSLRVQLVSSAFDRLVIVDAFRLWLKAYMVANKGTRSPLFHGDRDAWAARSPTPSEWNGFGGEPDNQGTGP
jgi:hypothetical protein